MTIAIAVLLSALLIPPADGLRFEWARACQATGTRPAALLGYRLLATGPMAALVALGVAPWANAGPFGLPLLVFAGALSAAWLWMWFWIKTFVADPAHPLRPLDIGVTLASLVSLTLWLTLFTFQALVAAWMEEVTWRTLMGATLVWLALDLAWQAGLARLPAGYRLIQSERHQKWVNRLCGTLLLALALWAVAVALD